MSFATLCTTSLVILLVTVLPTATNHFGSVDILPAQAQAPDARKAEAEADRLFNQGTQQFQTSQFEAARQSWQQALTIYRNIQDQQSEGAALGNLGNAYYALEEYGKAIEYYQQNVQIAREIKDRQSEGIALGNLGLAYYSLGDYSKARALRQAMLSIRKTYPAPLSWAAFTLIGVAK